MASADHSGWNRPEDPRKLMRLPCSQIQVICLGIKQRLDGTREISSCFAAGSCLLLRISGMDTHKESSQPCCCKSQHFYKPLRLRKSAEDVQFRP